eukprot:CAMPEP_0114239894 /NCGR_PEP_ID=MMETSP0058-20121206/8722_1 /TAXON_ID=36894 /ORGANISM="Pyramimonas parkeae, CCMP726" /LENGTH=260 /DNA_ID=CAMNT_0001352143 /DNA_START=341 /DNA_END=1120 /DNA_ORIENTATION=+
MTTNPPVVRYLRVGGYVGWSVEFAPPGPLRVILKAERTRLRACDFEGKKQSRRARLSRILGHLIRTLKAQPVAPRLPTSSGVGELWVGGDAGGPVLDAPPPPPLHRRHAPSASSVSRMLERLLHLAARLLERRKRPDGAQALSVAEPVSPRQPPFLRVRQVRVRWDVLRASIPRPAAPVIPTSEARLLHLAARLLERRKRPDGAQALSVAEPVSPRQPPFLRVRQVRVRWDVLRASIPRPAAPVIPTSEARLLHLAARLL